MRSVIDNRRWQTQGLWHYIEAREEVHRWGYFVVKNSGDFRFWCSTPSAAYWLCANLNEHMVGEEMTYRTKRQRDHNDEWRPMKVYS